MSEEQNGQTRSEQPTEKKKLDSRKKGQIARSRELNTTVVMLSSAAALLMLGGGIGQSLQRLLATGLTLERQLIFDDSYLLLAFGQTSLASLQILTPFFLLMMIAAFVGPLSLGGWSFSMDSWVPKLNRMSILSGIKRMFGIQGFVELLKALGKFIVVGAVAVIALKLYQDEILMLSQLSVTDAIYRGMYIIGQLFLMLAVSLIVVSLIDVPYQIVSHITKIKMSVQEVKEENKQTNGNPELKTRIRSMQRDVSQRRMLIDAADADVVIVNPTHFSVALKYDDAKAGAPVVVAKGVDHMALRIREVAESNNIVIFSAPPLARALYFHTDIDQQVPTALYQAVAQVLAYVLQVRDLTTSERLLVQLPSVVDVPEELASDNKNYLVDGAGK